jgi:hypothetical protein
MNMNKKLLGFMAIIFGIILILLIVYFIFFKGLDEIKETPVEPSSNNTQDLGNLPSINTGEEKEEIKKIKIGVNAAKKGEKISEIDLKRIASSFAERFGSYSNQAGYGNIDELEIFMSPAMIEWSKKYVTEMKSKNSNTSIYYGITTIAVTSNTIKYDSDEGLAEIKVMTQRRESLGTISNSKTFYQDIIIVFVKEKDVWKVNQAFWQSQQYKN